MLEAGSVEFVAIYLPLGRNCDVQEVLKIRINFKGSFSDRVM